MSSGWYNAKRPRMLTLMIVYCLKHEFNLPDFVSRNGYAPYHNVTIFFSSWSFILVAHSKDSILVYRIPSLVVLSAESSSWGWVSTLVSGRSVPLCWEARALGVWGPCLPTPTPAPAVPREGFWALAPCRRYMGRATLGPGVGGCTSWRASRPPVWTSAPRMCSPPFCIRRNGKQCCLLLEFDQTKSLDRSTGPLSIPWPYPFK